MKVVIYNNTTSLKAIDIFLENINAAKLEYNSFDLFKFGITKQIEIDTSVARSLQVCNMSGIPVKQHFKVCYRSDKDVVIKYWMFSQTGLKLILLNSGVINKFIAKIQMELTNPSHSFTK